MSYVAWDPTMSYVGLMTSPVVQRVVRIVEVIMTDALIPPR